MVVAFLHSFQMAKFLRSHVVIGPAPFCRGGEGGIITEGERLAEWPITNPFEHGKAG